MHLSSDPFYITNIIIYYVYYIVLWKWIAFTIKFSVNKHSEFNISELNIGKSLKKY